MRARRSMLALRGGTAASLLASRSDAQNVDQVPGLTQLEFQERMHNATSDAEREQVRTEDRNRVRQRQGGSGSGSGGHDGGRS